VPEVECRLDPATGRLELHIKGIVGPACDDVAAVVREVLGRPALEQQTADYAVRPRARVAPRVRARRP
jgi:hypothetical protein